MTDKFNKIIDLVILFALTGIGMAATLNLLPYINKLHVFYKIVAVAAAQFAIAGLGTVIIMFWRKQKLSDFGLKRENII